MLRNTFLFGHRSRHTRLVELVSDLQPKTFLEVGVWDGQRAAQLLSVVREPVQYFGFDSFPHTQKESLTSKSSGAPFAKEEIEDLIKDAAPHAEVVLFSGDITHSLPAARSILPILDFVFIDGGHSYEMAKYVWELICDRLDSESVAIMDDVVNQTALEEESIGINRLTHEIAEQGYDVELLSPVDWWPKPWGILKKRFASIRNPAINPGK